MEIETQHDNKHHILSFLKSFPIAVSSSQTSRQIPTVYKNQSAKFLIPERKNFNTQYCHLYFIRLMAMKPYMTSNLLTLGYNPMSILKLPKDSLCCVIGILYKEMKLKPSILQKIGGSLDNNNYAQLSSFTSDDDLLYIEDENGKVKLDLSEFPQGLKNLCSGLVVGISGIYDGKCLKVKDMHFPGSIELNVQPSVGSLTSYFKLVQPNDKFIALISGLGIDGAHGRIDYHLNWLKQLMYGNLNNDRLVQVLSKVGRVVIAGNSIKKETISDSLAFVGAVRAQELYNKAGNDIKVSMALLDSFICELSKSMAVDILPGEHDPNTNFFPYQPLNKLYFEKSFNNKHFTAVSNPYAFEVDSRKVLGTSGINIQDLRKSGFEEKTDLELLELSLKWGHLAPTSPETIR